MKLKVEYSEKELRELIIADLQAKLGDIRVVQGVLSIEVKSKNNWKMEWEPAQYRASFTLEN